MFALIGASAIVAAAAVGIGVSPQASGGSIAGEGMSTGLTVTAETPPSAAPIPQAVPDIKGPAPLPPEEQGLPG